MVTLFIADLHLSQNEPAITAGFLTFLQNEARHADALYILGDLFEVWIGDDDTDPYITQIADALQKLSQQGVKLFFIHGNRDFLISSSFAKRCAMTLLPSEKVVNVYGYPILILHGDTLCTDDLAYQRFRKRIHNPIFRYLFLHLPLRLRLAIANRLRQRSQQANSQKAMALMEVNSAAVQHAFQKHQIHHMIHGHTHRGAIHHLKGYTTPHYRIVLNAWHHKGSVVRFYPNGHFSLSEIPFED